MQGGDRPAERPWVQKSLGIRRMRGDLNLNGLLVHPACQSCLAYRFPEGAMLNDNLPVKPLESMDWFPHLPPVIRALFFDAAGTLIEPAEPVADVYARAAAAAGYPVEAAAVKRAFGAAFSGIGDPDWKSHPHGDAAEREWWRAVVCGTFGEILGKPLADTFAVEVFDGLFSHYADPQAWRVFPEVREVLEACREAGLRTAVVSNFDRRLHGILEGHGLYFEAVVTSADACSRKPEAGIFQYTLDLLGLAPQEVFHAGDSRAADLEGAEAIGIGAFLLQRPGTDLRDFLDAALEKQGK